MNQSIYNLPDLLDLALKVPEIGAVNFNILHTVILTMINELRLHNVRPTCFIENPLLAKSALTKVKLQRKESRIIEDNRVRGVTPIEEPPRTKKPQLKTEPSKSEETPPPQAKISETEKESEKKVTGETGEEKVKKEPPSNDETESEPIERPEDMEQAPEERGGGGGKGRKRRRFRDR
ncbi:uncharacterized protein NPIL_207741 [Nephila pilipes]|uniref:Uncharacterized protein n=1 Tax=Nephila pilipes TaxID=299642 RepID=A0A8X6N410_NEPPI|nr:uncharacterized protein NPIL_207741 [Nephila pilipes]